MTNATILATAIKQVAGDLRRVPKTARHGQWQIAKRRLDNARLLETRNPEQAQAYITEAMFLIPFITY